MVLLLVPSFVTNVWQAIAGGKMKPLIARIWLFLLLAGGMIWVGTAILTRVHVSFLSGLLGALIVLYSLVNLGGMRITVPPEKEVWLGPLTGSLNGVLTGMTGSFMVPGVVYLQAIGLSRDALVQAMAMLFTVSTIALTLALGGNGLLTQDLGLLSALAVIPAMIGMLIGQRLRQRMSEILFRRVFFVGLLFLGGYITVRSIV